MTCNCNYTDEIVTLKQKVSKLEEIVQKLQKTQFKALPLSFVAKDLNITRQTLTYHIKANYIPEVDFYIKNNKIFLNMGILPSIKEYYNA